MMPIARGITYAVLGPLEVRQAGRFVRLSGRQRAVLGVLLLHANQTVSRDQLVDALWDVPPRSAIANLQTHISGLRRAFSAAPPDLALRLETRGSGYNLSVDRDRLDLLLLANLARRGRELAAHGDLAAAERQLDDAVSLWRGRPLADVSLSGLVLPRLAEIEEQLVQVWSAWIDVRMSQGDHERLIGELHRALELHPLREPIWGRLIVALYRAGRRSEALEAFQRAHTVLVSELGVGPGSELRQVQAAVLRGDPSIGWPAPGGAISPVPTRRGGTGEGSLAPGRRRERPLSPAVPAQEGHTPSGRAAAGGDRVRPAEVPYDVPRFTGRGAELVALDTSLAAEDDGRVSTYPNVWIISGTAGVGKTGLAVHWAHNAAEAFPDGQLHVDLHGFDPKRDPLEPAAALAQMLTSLGVGPTQIPEGGEERAKQFRSMVAGRRILLLLDGARTAEQVRPLLPGRGGAVVLITSRNRLNDLVVSNDARSLPLAPLNRDDAHELLSRMVGAKRLTAEPEAADELARLCGHLPLAMRIAAANIADDPAGTIAGAVRVLAYVV